MDGCSTLYIKNLLKFIFKENLKGHTGKVDKVVVWGEKQR